MTSSAQDSTVQHEKDIPTPELEGMSYWQRHKAKRNYKAKFADARRARRGVVKDTIYSIIEVVTIVFFIQTIAIQAFRIPTGSMEDTLLVGDFLIVNKFVYGIRTPDWIGIPFTKF